MTNEPDRLVALRAAWAGRPDDPDVLVEVGTGLRRFGDVHAAIEAFERATRLAPAHKVAWFHLGNALRATGRAERARSAFEAALRCDPGFVPARGALGDVLASLGDIAGAAACYRVCLAAPSHAPRAWFHLAALKTVRLSTTDIDALRSLERQPRLADRDRLFVGYALAQALDDHGDFAAAFAVLAAASSLKRRLVGWDATVFHGWVQSIETAFAQVPDPGPGDGFGREAIFLVSMPRAGSTLTEQILASHAQVDGAGEIPALPDVIREESLRRGKPFPQWIAEATPDDWRRLGEDYLARAARFRGDRPSFTDKGLDNWPLVGAAAAMLPGARFVDCRRDALETCWSCYRQLFAQGNEFSYDFADLGAYWRDYDRLSRSWRERHPGRVFESHHEALIANPGAHVRSLLDFLGLPFDPACLAFHATPRAVATLSAAQVRQPLRRDTASADRYGALLDPLRRAIAGDGTPD